MNQCTFLEPAPPLGAPGPWPQAHQTTPHQEQGTTKCKVSHATALSTHLVFYLFVTFVNVNQTSTAPFEAPHFRGKPSRPQPWEHTLLLGGHGEAPSNQAEAPGESEKHAKATRQGNCTHIGAHHHLRQDKVQNRGLCCGQEEHGSHVAEREWWL